MPEPYQTNNPLEFTQLPGVYISEKTPPPTVISVGTNNVIFIGQFERGPENQPTAIGSITELADKFGNNLAYTGNKALRLKRWTNLHVIRALAAAAAAANVTQTVTAKNTFTATALYKGLYGNNIKINISDGTNANTKKFTITDEGTSEIEEVYDNLNLPGKTDNELAIIFQASRLVKITSAHATEEPADGDLTLTGGTDGVIASTDYATAIANADIRANGRIYFTDDQSAGTKAALSNFVKLEQAGICIVGPSALTTTVDAAITDAATYLDQNGRVLYAYNPVLFNINGNLEEESPVYLTASVLGGIAPQISPLSVQDTRNLTATAAGVKFNINRTNLKRLREAGIMAYEFHPNPGSVKLATAPTGNPQMSIKRRRFTDFYLKSIALFLENYQSRPNSLNLRKEIYANIIQFDQGLVNSGTLPSEQDEGIKVLKVETEGLVTPNERAQGLLKISIQRRLFASADFIVLEAEIGETVQVKELRPS